MLKLYVVSCLVAISIIGFLNIYQVHAKVQNIDPDILDYHLKLAKGMLETCFTRDSETDVLIPNPTLPILSDLANTCDKKMKSLDTFLAKFVNDKNGKVYADHIANNSVS